jgi:hypothetical protein
MAPLGITSPDPRQSAPTSEATHILKVLDAARGPEASNLLGLQVFGSKELLEPVSSSMRAFLAEHRGKLRFVALASGEVSSLLVVTLSRLRERVARAGRLSSRRVAGEG